MSVISRHGNMQPTTGSNLNSMPFEVEPYSQTNGTVLNSEPFEVMELASKYPAKGRGTESGTPLRCTGNRDGTSRAASL